MGEEEIKADSLLYGIIETESEEGEKKFALKFIMERNGKKIICWITDLLTVLTLQKMCEDYIRLMKGEEETEDIEKLLPKLTDAVNEVIAQLRRGGAEGKNYYEVIVDLCEQINLTKEQTEKVLSIIIASVKLVEDLYKRRGEAMDYIR